MKLIPYSRQEIDSEDIQAVVNTLKSDFITQGPVIQKFEEALAKKVDAKYCVVFNSGTAALHAAHFVAGVTKGDETITSPMTFVATSNVALYLGAKPKFVDIEEDTGNIDPNNIEGSITKNTKAVVPVHYSGHPVDLERIKTIADKHKLFIIEDASHALGALYKGTKIGSCSYSDMTIFSFHPVKHITLGEGGAVTTNNKKLYEKLKIFRTHGIVQDSKQLRRKDQGAWYYEMQELGFNYRTTDIQTALGLTQLKKLNRFVAKRREIAQRYNELLKDNSFFDLPPEKAYGKSSYHLYSVRLKDKYLKHKKGLFSRLREEGIRVQVHYIPVYLHPFYQDLGYKGGSCPIAEKFYEQELSIPIYPSLAHEDINKVAFVINRVFREFN